MNKVIIELKDVWKTYAMGEEEVHALRGINLKIHKGNFVAITGSSGSGKSTMMNLVGCLDKPSKGDIFLDNRNIAHLSESKLSEIRGKKIGFVFQQFNLIPTLTAKENVMLPMEFQDVSSYTISKRAEKLMGLVDLKDRMNHKPTELSGGQMQRVAIARSLSNDPEVVLADEPTGNLDSHTGEYILKFLGDLHKKGKTIIMVTHDRNLVKYAHRIIELKDGMIVKDFKNKNPIGGRKNEK